MDKQLVAYTNSGILISNKKEWRTHSSYNRMNLRNIKQSESSQKVTYFMILLYKTSRIGKFIVKNRRLVVALRVGNNCLMATGFHWGMMKHFGTRKNWWLHSSVNVPTATIHLKMVNVLWCSPKWLLKLAQISHFLVMYLHLSHKYSPQLSGLLSTPLETLAHTRNAGGEKRKKKWGGG